jgi:hypothetical protein
LSNSSSTATRTEAHACCLLRQTSTNFSLLRVLRRSLAAILFTYSFSLSVSGICGLVPLPQLALEPLPALGLRQRLCGCILAKHTILNAGCGKGRSYPSDSATSIVACSIEWLVDSQFIEEENSLASEPQRPSTATGVCQYLAQLADFLGEGGSIPLGPTCRPSLQAHPSNIT